MTKLRPMRSLFFVPSESRPFSSTMTQSRQTRGFGIDTAPSICDTVHGPWHWIEIQTDGSRPCSPSAGSPEKSSPMCPRLRFRPRTSLRLRENHIREFSGKQGNFWYSGTFFAELQSPEACVDICTLVSLTKNSFQTPAVDNVWKTRLRRLFGPASSFESILIASIGRCSIIAPMCRFV